MIFRGTVFSAVMEMDTQVTVVAPARLPKNRPHKVVYLLHGLCGDANSWVDYTRLPLYANEYDFVFILPSVGRSFYTDMKFGEKYFSYVVDELPDLCRKLFNISPEPEDTMIVGGSMGGYGALKAAFTKPNQYGVCCALASGSLFMADWLDEIRKDRTKAERFYGKLVHDMEMIFGEDLYFDREEELLHLAKKASKGEKKPQIYMSCGTGDYLLKLNRQFAEEMKKLEFSYVYEELEGQHDWYFFDKALQKSLQWIANCKGSEWKNGNS